jgi:hypothetical protein
MDPNITTNTPLEDFQVIDPEDDDVREEIERLAAFHDYLKEKQGDNLTFGDY